MSTSLDELLPVPINQLVSLIRGVELKALKDAEDTEHYHHLLHQSTLKLKDQLQLHKTPGLPASEADIANEQNSVLHEDVETKNQRTKRKRTFQQLATKKHLVYLFCSNPIQMESAFDGEVTEAVGTAP
uniref:Uncharacterized protein n=1 Tax=Ditylenchus dipsaci TaxID=166011 RepID=A0A915EL87_9BILA